MMLLVQIVTLITSSMLLVYALSKICKMNSRTLHTIRASYIFIAVASFTEFSAILLYSHLPNASEMLLFTGFAVLQLTSRRSKSHTHVKGAWHA